jgi:hypothetical protein
MTVTLAENTTETLTNKVWEQWENTGITSRLMTKLEVKHLADHFLKLCREQSRDYREFDFYTLIDSNLNYYENKAEIENTLGGLNSEAEKTAANKLNDYLTEDSLKEYTAGERSVIEEVQTKNQNIEKRVKANEKQTVNMAENIAKVRDMQDQIMAKLESLPNLEKQIEALQNSQSFKDLGNALSPVIIATKPETNKLLSKQVQAILTNTNPETPNQPAHTPTNTKDAPKHKPKTLDWIAGLITIIIWTAATGWTLQTYPLTWALIIELSVLWLFFIVVFRLMTGGLLD